MNNVWEELALWQQHDEQQNLELINRYEAATFTAAQAAQSFQTEVIRRQSNDI